MGCARVRLVSPHPHKSKQRHMVSRASVCQEGAGRLWRSHPRACPGPAQSPGSPQQDTGSPQTDSLEPGTAPTPPSSLRHIPVGMEPAPGIPSLPVAWSTGEGPRPLRAGAAGSCCPPCLCPLPLRCRARGRLPWFLACGWWEGGAGPCSPGSYAGRGLSWGLTGQGTAAPRSGLSCLRVLEGPLGAGHPPQPPGGWQALSGPVKGGGRAADLAA